MSDIGADVRIWAFPIAAIVIAGAITWATGSWQVAMFPLLLAVLASGVLFTVNHARVQAWHEERSDASRRTTRLLHGLRSRGHRVLRSRALPDSDADLEHLVIGPGGVLALRSKRFRRQIPMRAMHGNLFHGPQSQQPLLDVAFETADHVSEALSGQLRQEIPVTPAVIVYGSEVPWKVLRLRRVDVLSVKRLRRYIANRSRRLSPVEIERVTAAAEAAFPAREEQHAAAPHRP